MQVVQETKRKQNDFMCLVNAKIDLVTEAVLQPLSTCLYSPPPTEYLQNNEFNEHDFCF